MEIDHKIKLITSVGEEVISEEDLKDLLINKPHPVAYNGFEPSGKIHIAQCVLTAINMNKLVDAGCHVKMFVADWHAQANNKLGGDLEKIQTTGKYFIEVWKACGMKLDHVEFVWASDLVKDPEYWQLVVKIAMMNSVDRIKRCSQIMGRSDEENLSAAMILYPCMQAADIFYMGVDICQLGMDQRKVNVLAREIAPKFGHRKPIIVSHHMLLGLLEPPKGITDPVARANAMKMSKSIPDSAIFATDAKDEVESKIKKAYCPQGEVKDNPILEYCKYILFEAFDTITISRSEKFGGDISFTSYAALEEAFAQSKIHPMDLKTAVAKYINALLDPIRKHFETNANAKRLKETVESYTITR